MSTNAARREDLDDILDAIREVEASLETREARANAATGMVWGLAASSIFVYYQWLTSNPGLVGDAVPLVVVRWGWVLPVAIGYLVTTAIGARLGRAARDRRATRSIRRLLAAIAGALVLVTLVSVTGRGADALPGMWIAFLGFTHLLFPTPEDARERRAQRALLATHVLAGVALVLATPLHPWANGIAAAWYLVFLFGACAREYYSIRR